jgi:chromosome segregation ATPase
MPLNKNTQSIIQELNSLHSFVNENQSIPLSELIIGQKLNDLIEKTRLLIKNTREKFEEATKEDPTDIIREKVIDLFSLGNRVNNVRKLLNADKAKNENKKKEEIKNLAKKIKVNKEVISLQFKDIEAARYINLCLLDSFDEIISLSRYINLDKSLTLKKFEYLNQEKKYEIVVQVCKEALQVQRGNPIPTLLFSDLAKLSSWETTKSEILKQLNQPQQEQPSIDSSQISNTRNSDVAAHSSSSEEILATSTNKKAETQPAVDKSNSSINQNATEITDLENQLQQLEQEKIKSKEKYLSLERSKADLEKEIADLKKEAQNNNALEQEYESNKNQLVQLKADFERLQKDLQKKKAEIETLREIKEKTLPTLKKEKISLEDKINKKQQGIETSEKKIVTLEQQQEALQSQVKETEKKLAETTEALKLKSLNYDILSNDLKSVSTKNKFVTDEKNSQEKINKKLLEEVKQVNEEITEFRKSASESSAKAKNLSRAVDQLETDLKDKESKLKILAQEKSDTDILLSKQKVEHAALEAKHETLKADSVKQAEELQKQHIAFTQINSQLDDKEIQLEQLQIQIDEKNTQNIDLQENITKIKDLLQKKQTESQLLAEKLKAIEQQLIQTEKVKESATAKITENGLEIHELKKKIQELEPLKGKISQAKEKYKQLTTQLNSEEHKTLQLNGELSALYEQVLSFIQAVKTELNKLSPTETQAQAILEPIDPKYLITPLDTTIPIEDESDASNTLIGKLDQLKHQITSIVNNLDSQAEKNKNRLKTKEAATDELLNQFKELQKSTDTQISQTTEKLTKEKRSLEEQVTSLTNQISELENQIKQYILKTTPPTNSVPEFEFEDDDLNGPIHADDSDSEEEADDYQSFAVTQEELISTKDLLSQRQNELEQKNNELTTLKNQLITQKTQSNSTQEELQKEIADLQNTFRQTELSISTLTAEKENLHQAAHNTQVEKVALENKIRNLRVEQEELKTNKSTNKEQIAGLTDQIKQLEKLQLEQEKSIQDLTTQIEEKDNEIHELTTDQQSLTSKLENANQQNEQLNNTNQELLSTNSSLVTQLKSKLEEKEYVNLEEEKNNEINSLMGKIKTIQQQLDSGQKNVDSLNQKIADSQRQLQELIFLIFKERKMPGQDFPAEIVETPLNLDISNKNSGEMSPTYSDPTSSSSASLVSTPKSTFNSTDASSAYFNLFEQSQPLENGMPTRDRSRSDSDLGSPNSYRSLNASSSRGNSTDLNNTNTEISSGSELELEDGEENLIAFSPPSSRRPSVSQDLITSEEGRPSSIPPISTGSVLEPPIINTRNDATSMPTPEQEREPHIDRLFSSDEFQENLKSALAEIFERNYQQAFVDSTLNQPDLTANLLVLESEKLKRKNLVDTTFTELQNHEDAIKTALLSLFNNPANHPLDSYLTIEKLLFDNIFNLPNQNSFELLGFLQNSLKENRSNAEQLIQHARGVIDAFKEENHEEINQAFSRTFLSIADNAANELFNGPIEVELPGFKDKLEEKLKTKSEGLASVLSSRPELLTGTIEKINEDELNASTYLEEVKDSVSSIIDTLKTHGKKLKDYVADIGEDLLIKLCTETLQNEEKIPLKEKAKTQLKAKLNATHLDIAAHTQIIETAAQELVSKIVEKTNIENLIESAKPIYTRHLNLLDATKKKLEEQLEQEIIQSFDHYFPAIHLDPILQKINGSQDLSEDEIQKLPSELQYANSAKDISLALQAKYPNLVNPKISEDYNTFKKLRLKLREKALVAIDQTPSPETIYEINNCDAKAWLEKKLHIVTDKSIVLNLGNKQQDGLDKKFKQSFPFSDLNEAAITSKDLNQLSDSLEALHGAKVQVAAQLYATFSKIETELTTYPKLIDDINVFSHYLNLKLANAFIQTENKWPVNNDKWKVNEQETTIILAEINKRLESDTSKWNLFNGANQRLTEEIAQAIYVDLNASNNNRFNELETKQLVGNTLKLLYQYPHVKDTLNKREQWKTNIQWLYALTEKLGSFSQAIEERIAKLESLQTLQKAGENQSSTTVKTMPGPVHIPINYLDNSLPNFTAAGEVFSKQGQLTPGETRTFSQPLRNGERREWSVTRYDDSLAYKTQKPWSDISNNAKDFFSNKMTYVKQNSWVQTNYSDEISFSQMIHAVNSFKESSVCTITIPKQCDKNMQRKLHLFKLAYNELHHTGQVKGPLLLCNTNESIKINKAEISVEIDRIKKELNLHNEELDNITTLSGEKLTQLTRGL